MSRHNNRRKIVNSEEQYKDLFEKRGVERIVQFETMNKIVYEQNTYDSVLCVDYFWKYGDTYWKLASAFYGQPNHWWVIAAFNKKPTEANNKIGDLIKIPVELSEALQVVR